MVGAGKSMTSYKELIVWQKSILLVKDLYQATGVFPKEELYGLSSQLRRAAVSIPSNIAEGNGRGALAEYLRFLHFARGSCYELETQLLISRELRYLDEELYQSLNARTEEIGRMLNSLIQKLSAAPQRQTPTD